MPSRLAEIAYVLPDNTIRIRNILYKDNPMNYLQ